MAPQAEPNFRRNRLTFFQQLAAQLNGVNKAGGLGQ